jgi:hypothetical protein
MNSKRNLTIGIVLTAAAGFIALQHGKTPTLGNETEAPFAAFTETATATYEPCAYMWASHDDLNLSPKIDEAVRAIESTASASAKRFGEDCVYADGHSTFGTMETDFYIYFPAEDLSKEENLGDLARQVMDIIIALPEDDVQGNKGFVEFSFGKTDTEQIVFRVGIHDYLEIPPSTTGIELLNNFYTPSPPRATLYPPTLTPTP